MNALRRSTLVRSAVTNAVVALAATGVAVLMARRAEYFGDLVFITVMMYSAGFVFAANLIIAIVQAVRKKEWVAHAIMMPGSLALFGLFFLVLTSL